MTVYTSAPALQFLRQLFGRHAVAHGAALR